MKSKISNIKLIIQKAIDAEKRLDVQNLLVAIQNALTQFEMAITSLMLQVNAKSQEEQEKEKYKIEAVINKLEKLITEVTAKVPKRLTLDSYSERFLKACHNSMLWNIDKDSRKHEIITDTVISVGLGIVLTIMLTALIMTIHPSIPFFYALIKLACAIVLSAAAASIASYALRPHINSQIYNSHFMETSAHALINSSSAFFSHTEELRMEQEDNFEIKEIGNEQTKSLGELQIPIRSFNTRAYGD